MSDDPVREILVSMAEECMRKAAAINSMLADTERAQPAPQPPAPNAVHERLRKAGCLTDIIGRTELPLCWLVPGSIYSLPCPCDACAKARDGK